MSHDCWRQEYYSRPHHQHHWTRDLHSAECVCVCVLCVCVCRGRGDSVCVCVRHYLATKEELHVSISAPCVQTAYVSNVWGIMVWIRWHEWWAHHGERVVWFAPSGWQRTTLLLAVWLLPYSDHSGLVMEPSQSSGGHLEWLYSRVSFYMNR